MNEEIMTAANEIYEKIAKLPEGSEFTMGEFFANYKFGMMERFKLMDEVMDLCKDNNIDLVNLQGGMELGMPWVFKFKKNN